MEEDSKPTGMSKPQSPKSHDGAAAPAELYDILGKPLLRKGEDSASETSGEPDWHKGALKERMAAVIDLSKALSDGATMMAKARRASAVTDADVRDALRRLVVRPQQTALIRVCRAISVVAILGGGAAINQGFQTGDYTLFRSAPRLALRRSA